MSLLVDGVLQAFAGTEFRHLGSLDLDGGASAWIATGARSALANIESAETYQRDHVTFLHCFFDSLDCCIQCAASGSFGNISRVSDGIDQFRFVHVLSPSVKVAQENPVAAFIATRKTLCQAVFRAYGEKIPRQARDLGIGQYWLSVLLLQLHLIFLLLRQSLQTRRRVHLEAAPAGVPVPIQALGRSTSPDGCRVYS